MLLEDTLFANKTFSLALFTSLIANVLIWGASSFTVFFHRQIKKDLQISYVEQVKENTIKVASIKQDAKVKAPLPPAPSMTPHKRLSGLNPENPRGTGIKMQVGAIDKPDVSDVKKFTVSKVKPSFSGMDADDFVDLDKLSKLKTKPVFLNYYREIRERIRRYAILNYPANFAQGEVYLTFVIGADGQLQELSVIDFKSTGDRSLREAGLRSVKEASPFDPFPDGMKRDKISFHIIISFELGS